MRLVLVIAGGGLGSASRYLVGLWFVERFGTAYPWATLSINVVGSFLIGLIATLADEAGAMSSQPRAFLVIGVLGGFTTFSSFALETFRLGENASLVRAASYIAASVCLSLIAAILGVGLGRAVS